MAWAYELVGRSGAGASGMAPLMYQTIEAWARLTGRDLPEPEEVHALVRLDAAILAPDPVVAPEVAK